LTDDPDANDRAILRALLDAHPRMIELDDLSGNVAGVDVIEVVDRLAGDGVVTRLGGMAGVTTAARRFAALGL
jgi:hypothetical protein